MMRSVHATLAGLLVVSSSIFATPAAASQMSCETVEELADIAQDYGEGYSYYNDSSRKGYPNEWHDTLLELGCVQSILEKMNYLAEIKRRY
jgi:hypothetical protein